ncbi:TerD family protein [Streptomyces sp. NPDC048297]|uniref:TerD family protein n=1 Tax=Streptomyces sp. NPDC048297 TaxID=3365531 RepID=UPI00370FDD6F
MDLARVEGAIERIVLAASADGGTFGQVPDLAIEVTDAGTGAVVARFDSPGASVETAFVLGEFYRRQGGWKFRAVGQGYSSGLEGLATDFGITVDEPQQGAVPPGQTPAQASGRTPAPMPAPPAAPPVAPPVTARPPAAVPPPPPLPPSPPSPPVVPPSPPPSGTPLTHLPPPPPGSTPAPLPPPPSAQPVRLSKVTLTKAAPSVSLTKQGGSSGAMRVNLNWQVREQFRGRGRRRGDVDLDLGALYELADGRKGVVQALGNAFGSLSRPPYIHLDGDDRTGGLASGENLTVNLDHTRDFRRILVFVTIYEGASSFADLHATVTFQPQNGAPVEFSLDECTVPSSVCALALITNTGGDLVVQREARYLVPERGVSPQRTMDRAYGWGMNWTPGRK